MGWDRLSNGVLLQSAASNGIEAFVSIDKKLEHEQNLRSLPLPVIVIDSLSNALPELIIFVPFILKLLGSPLEKKLYVVKADGSVITLSAPRG
jgi:hypothetical protein